MPSRTRRDMAQVHRDAEERRARLLNVIQQNPGITYRGLGRTSGVIDGLLRFHLAVLVRRNAVVYVRDGWVLRHYAAEHGVPTNVAAHAVLREPAMAQLAHWLRDHPGSRQTPILAAFAEHGWSRSTTQNRLNRLARAGVIAQVRNGPAISYRPLP